MKRITLGVIIKLLAGLLWYRDEHDEWYISIDITETEQDR